MVITSCLSYEERQMNLLQLDYKKFNKVTEKNSYSVPRIDNTLSMLASFQWFFLKSKYRQFKIYPEDKKNLLFNQQ